jgi:integrase
VLTDKALQALKPREKPYKKADERGLYVIVRPDGALWWRLKYRWRGKEKLLSLGTYPDTNLKAARRKRDNARVAIAAGTDPSAARQAEKAVTAETFEAVAREWLGKQKKLKPTTVEQLRHRLEKYAFPHIFGDPVATLAAPDVLAMLRRVESRGKHETAHRIRSLAGRVFRYAVASGRAERDPTADLKGALTAKTSRHFAAITEKRRVAELMRVLDGYQGQPAVMAALKIAPLVFVRPGELRGARWSEFDLEAAEWLIPGERMKMGRDHIVPLSTQALAIVDDLQAHTGRGTLLFPSLRHADRPISDNTLNAALRSLGYSKDEQTAHGFRTIASTLLHELGYASDVIELQLAHAERNKTKASYNRAERLTERRTMMQSWADYLDGLKADTGAKVRAIRG